MRDVDVQPAIRYLLALATDKDAPDQLLEPALRTLNTRPAAVALAHATIRAIRDRAPYTPRSRDDLPPAHHLALVVLNSATDGDSVFTALDPTALADVCIALLGTYRQVVQAQIAHETPVLTPSQRAWDGLLTPETATGDHNHQDQP